MMINSIKVKEVLTPYNYYEDYLCIDDIPITQYVHKFVKENNDSYLKVFGELNGLYPAWGKELLWKGEINFIWKLISFDEPTILPILVCEDDLDLSCIVIVVYVRKDKAFVYFDKIGYVIHDNEDFQAEKESGILNLEAYTDEDWDKYGDNIALSKVNSKEWSDWISINWDEELYRRRMNYTLPYYKTEGNIKWINDVNWIFSKEEYNSCIEFYEGKKK